MARSKRIDPVVVRREEENIGREWRLLKTQKEAALAPFRSRKVELSRRRRANQLRCEHVNVHISHDPIDDSGDKDCKDCGKSLPR